jgi:hypothetical protein
MKRFMQFSDIIDIIWELPVKTVIKEVRTDKTYILEEFMLMNVAYRAFTLDNGIVQTADPNSVFEIVSYIGKDNAE